MWYFNGEIIKHPKAMLINDLKYNKALFKDTAKMAELGIKPYSEVSPNNRYYSNGTYTVDTSGSEVVGTYASVDRDVDTLKASMLNTINSKVASKQGAIDWYWTRADKGGTAVPSNIKTYATTIYSEQSTKEGEVAALDTLAKIIEYENRPHTEVRKVEHTAENGDVTYGPDTESFSRDVNMLTHWTDNPNDEVDPAFVSLTAD